MKRKETKLEYNLKTLGFTLSYKTYEGKHRDKVSGYVYERKSSLITYTVTLNKTREEIVNYAFINKYYDYFDKGRLEGLQEVYKGFGEELSSIYDFENKVALDLGDFRAFKEDFDEDIDYIGGDDFND